jgi:hypothetical protein
MATPLGARTRLVLTSLLVTFTILLAACGGNDDPRANATPSTAPTSSGDPSDSPSPSESVAPASGKTVDMKVFDTHVPAGWQVQVSARNFSVTAYDLKSGDQIAFSVVSLAGNDFTLSHLAHQALRLGPWTKTPTIEPETTLAGEPAYHLTGAVGAGGRGESLGAAYKGNDVRVVFQISGPQTKLDRVRESVLASWQWN